MLSLINLINKSLPAVQKLRTAPAVEVGQTIKYFNEKDKTRKEIQTAPIENTNNADNNTVQQNNEEWRKRIH